MSGAERRVARRIQLRRTAGWRKPAGAVVVARPSRWGNPFRLGVDGDAARCVAAYRRALLAGELGVTVDDVRRDLAGHDLACWCPPDRPCHADVLLEIAGEPRRPGPSGSDDRRPGRRGGPPAST